MKTKNIEELKNLLKENTRDLTSDRARYSLCFLLTGGHNTRHLRNISGIPEPLIELIEEISGTFNTKQMIIFFENILLTIGTDGKDISKIVWKFLSTTLKNIPPQKTEVQEFLDFAIQKTDLFLSRKSQSRYPSSFFADEDYSKYINFQNSAFYACLDVKIQHVDINDNPPYYCAFNACEAIIDAIGSQFYTNYIALVARYAAYCTHERVNVTGWDSSSIDRRMRLNYTMGRMHAEVLLKLIKETKDTN